jgi:hypothetical protein
MLSSGCLIRTIAPLAAEGRSATDVSDSGA